jgi:hypothetical protein
MTESLESKQHSVGGSERGRAARKCSVRTEERAL